MCHVMLLVCLRSVSLGNRHWHGFVQFGGPALRSDSRKGEREEAG